MQGVQFVQCDGSAEDQALCRDLNISATPTTLVGMEVYQGPAQEAKCDAAGVNGYPAWNIGGAMLPGYMSLSRLAKVSRMPGVEVVDAAE
ncbi:unnamed protein product [Symbiodinium sp. KB8]|nr:unnamed protein product [Symbiodinium sp. KB8]